MEVAPRAPPGEALREARAGRAGAGVRVGAALRATRLEWRGDGRPSILEPGGARHRGPAPRGPGAPRAHHGRDAAGLGGVLGGARGARVELARGARVELT